jgi:hypothetical protein
VHFDAPLMRRAAYSLPFPYIFIYFLVHSKANNPPRSPRVQAC